MKNSTVLMLSLLCSTSLLFAHPGHELPGMLQGLWHPFLGLDHILAGLAVGVLAARTGQWAQWGFPLAFIGGVLAGGLAGALNSSAAYYEKGILLSVLLLGIAPLLPQLQRIPRWVAMALAFFGACHGYAHALESATVGPTSSYFVGFILATALLHGLGILWYNGMEKKGKRLSIPFQERS